MSFFLDGLREAWELIIHHDPYLMHLIWVTLKVAAVSTVVALVVGLPIGLVLGLGRFRGRGGLMVLANAGLGLPPVVVGLVLALLMFPEAPLGRFHLLFTPRGSTSRRPAWLFRSSSPSRRPRSPGCLPGLLDQARAYGARRRQLAGLALRECRVGILAATIAAVGSALSEVGAVVLVGGNIEGYDQTLASAALEQVDAGHFAEGMAIGILLLGLILVITAGLTFLQHFGATRRLGRAS